MPLVGKTLHPTAVPQRPTFRPISFNASCLFSKVHTAVRHVVDLATNHLAVLFAQAAQEHPDREFLVRSEEHTSELQSPCNLVCRLLLEKKKNTSELQSPCNLICRLMLANKSRRHTTRTRKLKLSTRREPTTRLRQ